MPSAKNNWNEIPYTSVNCCKAGVWDRRKYLAGSGGVLHRFVMINVTETETPDARLWLAWSCDQKRQDGFCL